MYYKATRHYPTLLKIGKFLVPFMHRHRSFLFKSIRCALPDDHHGPGCATGITMGRRASDGALYSRIA